MLDSWWTCEVCGQWRPDELITVTKHNLNLEHIPEATRNVRHCMDHPHCCKTAGEPSHWVKERQRCPDGGTCHHRCAEGSCFRVKHAEPLSGVYSHDEWPADVREHYSASEG